MTSVYVVTYLLGTFDCDSNFLDNSEIDYKTRGTAIAVGRARRRAPRSCIIYTRNCGFGYIKKASVISVITSWHTHRYITMILPPKMVKPIFRVFFHVFDPPNWGNGSSWGADFGVVGKPIPTFLIPVYWSHFDISLRFRTNRLNIVNKRDFRRGGHFGVK